MHLDKRKLLGPLFQPLSTLKHSDASRILTATLWMPSQIIRARHNRPYFAVDIGSSKGMGAVIVEAILLCHYAEQRRLRPCITSTNPLYASTPGQDFISTYLGTGPPADAQAVLKPMRFRTLLSFYHLGIAQHASLADANRIFWRYFAPKPVITDRVDSVLATIGKRQFDLSMHYRGSDKALEASLADFAAYDDALQKRHRTGGRLSDVFLATDDAEFETFIRRRHPTIRFTTYNLGSPSDASRGRHFSDLDPQSKAIESLVNMFLLAAAPVCVRGASYMSSVSKIANLALETVSLTRTHTGSDLFPEHEIISAERSAATWSPVSNM